MNFDWKAFEEGKLAYNARTEEDAKAFLAECEKRGFVWKSGEAPTAATHYGSEEVVYVVERGRICYSGTTQEKRWFPERVIFSEPWKKQESVVELLRECISFENLLPLCCLSLSLDIHDRDPEVRERKVVAALADMVEAELEEAKQTRCMGYIDDLAHLGRLPERIQGETLEKYLTRTHVVLPRWDNDETVKEGDPYADTSVEHICVYSDGDWLLTMEDGSQLEGTLNQRAVYVEPDTQELIDWHATCAPDSYCRKFNLDVGDDPDDEDTTIAMVKHLLERQRKLDAKAGEQ